MEGFSLSSVPEKKQHLKSYKGKKKSNMMFCRVFLFDFFRGFIAFRVMIITI